MKKNIILITDGKAGHENISKGVIHTIEQYHDINIIKVHAKLRSTWLKRIITVILNQSSFWKEKKSLIDLFYQKVDVPEKMHYDLIVSTGGTTSFLNVMLSQYLGCPNLYCSSLRGLKYTFFTYIVSLEDHRYPNEIVVDTPPLSLKYNSEDVEKFRSENSILKTDSIWSVLIGGPTEDYPYSSNDFEKMVRSIIQLAKDHHTKLCITTSRRTTEKMEEKLYKIFDEEKDMIKKYVLYNQKPEKVMSVFLAVADKIFCTEESGSMVTEAVLSKKPVYTIKTDKANPKGIYKSFIYKLINHQNIVSTDVGNISLITFTEPIKSIEKYPAEIVYTKIKYLLEKNYKIETNRII